jgi:peptidoglycan/LPS O-acetylase OafA/YrhL
MPQAPAKAAPSRISALDGIRGIAILMVMLFHFGISAAPPGFLHDVIGFGWIGVDLFFALSGYLITGVLLDSPREKYFSRFYSRRVLRIFPVYYAFLILLFHVLPMTRGRAEEPWYWIYLANWRDATMQSRNIAHFWSLCIEEQFYLFWPLALYFVPRKYLKHLCVAVVVLCPALRLIGLHEHWSKYALYRMTPFRMEGLALGSLLALAAREDRLRSVIKRLLPWLCGIATLVVIAVLRRWGTDFQSPGMQMFGYTSLAVLASAGLFYSSKATGYLSDPRLVTFGKYSYGLYVWHMPIAEQLRLHVQAHPGWLTLLGCWVIGIGSAFGIALMSWTFIERPFLKLKDSLFS